MVAVKDKVNKVKLSNLVLDYEVYPREKIDAFHITELAEALEAGEVLPPIVADKKSMRIVDGFHRYKAYQRIKGDKAVVAVVLREYESDAALFLDAMKYNSGHGRSLTKYDKSRCINKAATLGLEPEVVASALAITRVRMDEMTRDRSAIYKMQPYALKQSAAHLAGENLNEKQVEYNQKAGGLNQLFYVNQVILMLETDTVDWTNERLQSGLLKLYNLLVDNTHNFKE